MVSDSFDIASIVRKQYSRDFKKNLSGAYIKESDKEKKDK